MTNLIRTDYLFSIVILSKSIKEVQVCYLTALLVSKMYCVNGTAINECESFGAMRIVKGKRCTLKITLGNFPLSTALSTWSDLVLNPDFRGGNTATNSFIRGQSL
jgi:hypothetical protein